MSSKQFLEYATPRMIQRWRDVLLMLAFLVITLILTLNVFLRVWEVLYATQPGGGKIGLYSEIALWIGLYFVTRWFVLHLNSLRWVLFENSFASFNLNYRHLGFEWTAKIRFFDFLSIRDIEEFVAREKRVICMELKSIRLERQARELQTKEQTRLQDLEEVDRKLDELIRGLERTPLTRQVQLMLKRNPKLSHKRNLLTDLARYAVMGQTGFANRDETRIERLLLRIAQFGDELCSEAAACYEKAIAIKDAKKQEEYLQAVILAQKIYLKQKKVLGEKLVRVPKASADDLQDPKMTFLNLQKMAYSKMEEIVGLLPDWIDPVMARAITACVFKPEKEGRLAIHHRRTASLEDKVRSLYERILPEEKFDSKKCAQTTSWFLKQAFLVEYDPKVTKGSYVINRQKFPTPTTSGERLINKVFAIGRNFG